MTNPFELIFDRLGNIENILLDLKFPIVQPIQVNRPLRLKEAADFIGVAPTTLYGLIAKKKIIPLKPGKHVLFMKSDLEAYLKGERPPTVKEDPSIYLIRNKKGGSK
jgi:excisionase family DNA binding protein